MRKNLLWLVILMLVFIKVEGETFKIGDYISGMYVKMESPSKNKYLTVQYIKTTSGEISYCIEPFILLDENANYEEVITNIADTINISKETLRRVELISYLGYGYKDRLDPMWYAITQVLIWKEVSKNANIYFTETSNGVLTNKYDSYMNEILNDVNNYDNDLVLNDVYEINVGSKFIINNIPSEYVISGKSPYSFTTLSKGTLQVLKVSRDGQIGLIKSSNNYDDKFRVYTNLNSQKVIKRGNVIDNEVKIVDIKIIAGTMHLNFYDDEVYPSSSKEEIAYSLRCDNYGLGLSYPVSGSVSYEKLLPPSKCKVFQNKSSDDFIDDEVIHEFEIVQNQDTYVDIYLKSPSIKLNINEYVCINDVCNKKGDIGINIYDSEMNLIKELISLDDDSVFINLKEGTYYIYSEQFEDYEEVDLIKLDLTYDMIEYNLDIKNNKHVLIEEVIEDDEEDNEEIIVVKDDEDINDDIIVIKDDELLEDVDLEDIVYYEETNNEIDVPYTGTKDCILVLFISISVLFIARTLKKL